MWVSELKIETEQSEEVNRVEITFRPVLVEADE
jgi:hypothetical protein